MFAVASIPMAKKYYLEFKKQLEEKHKDLTIATIYSFAANEEDTADGILDDEGFETDLLDQSSREFLDFAIGEYNKKFKTNFSSEGNGFQDYYKDLSDKVKHREIDLLIVVNMFLTGFDATTLNTLWVDKNLKQIVLLKSYDDYYYGYEDDKGKHQKGYEERIAELIQKYPLGEQIIGEQAKKDFIVAMDNILRLKNILSSFDKFEGNEILSERDFQDYIGTYTDEIIGTQIVDGKFSKQTRFLSEDKMIANMGKDALVNAGFNAASMVVGQYYMNEINDKLENIQHDIDGIANFLDTQYQGKLVYIISKIQEVLENKNEIIGNEFSRDKRYDEMSRIEENCAELLTQANASIIKYLKEELDYKNYEKNVKDIQMWSVRQQILMRLLAEIGDLRYVLANGNETPKSAHSQYNKYLTHTNKVNEQLDSWHEVYCEKFGISKTEHRRKANFFEIRKNTIGRINEEWAYNKLDESIETMIDSQMNVKEILPYSKDKQDENIKILKHNGEYYNLLKANE